MTALYLGHELGGDISTPELLRIKQKKAAIRRCSATTKSPIRFRPFSAACSTTTSMRASITSRLTIFWTANQTITPAAARPTDPSAPSPSTAKNSTRPAILPSPSVRRRRKHTNSYARGNCSTGLKTALKTKNWPAKSKNAHGFAGRLDQH